MVEFLAVITSFICVYHNIKAKWQAWIWSILACVLYAFVLYESKSWANFGLQFCFILISFYGLYEWLLKKKIDKNQKLRQISNLSLFQFIILFILLFIFSCVIFFSDFSTLFILDITTTFLSLIAQYLLAIKKIENWFFWIFANVLYLIMFFLLSLYWSILLYFIFILMAFSGFLLWRKEQITKSHQN
ncbi:MAG: hypothetical protein EAZ85_08530 [Bacteroidetes bacterium]|nr:MAG: hypothetical protein EAZ85_08530 [Bacteroidota bacterium]TAG89134.1 MAG: hypothetical protein EAZ20_07125 [Bacteroidota bacterium]